MLECLYQLELKRQMLRGIWPDAMQFIEQLGRDLLRFAMRHPMHDPMSHGLDRSEPMLCFEPVQ